jgi:hypothetical protein
MSETKHRCTVRQSGERAFFAYCKPRSGRCEWKGPMRSTLLGAWTDARSHDPDYPQDERRDKS